MKNDLDSAHTFFMEHEAGTFVPRAILIDMEPNCIGKELDTDRVPIFCFGTSNLIIIL